MKLAAWNVNSLNVRLPRLLDWLAATRPDVVCLQETKLEDPKFPAMELAAAGYASMYAGQKTYNGVAILVKSGLDATDIAIGIPEFADEQKRVIAATIAGIRVIGVYVPNGQSVDSDKYQYKLRWYAALAAMVRAELARHPQLAVLGDFNVAPEDRDVHDPALWAGQVLVSEPERAAFRALLDAGPGRQLSPVRPAAEDVLVVGLPAARVPEEQRPAHRPRAACPRRWRRAARRAASTATPARARSPPITHRCWSNCTIESKVRGRRRCRRQRSVDPGPTRRFPPHGLCLPDLPVPVPARDAGRVLRGAARVAQRRAARGEPRVLRVGRGAVPAAGAGLDRLQLRDRRRDRARHRTRAGASAGSRSASPATSRCSPCSSTRTSPSPT